MRVVVVVACALALAPASAARRGDVVAAAALDTVLTRFVHAGRVDYRALAREPGALRRYLSACAEAEPQGHSRASQIAFWINAYNARVLDGVIRRPGLKRVTDPPATPDGADPGFFAERRRTARRALSLDQIERDILRARFHEPRVHFALNCASSSCPPLPERAFAAATLDSDLERAVRRFLADPSRNRAASDGALELSAIFEWYAADFAAAGGAAAFVARHWPGPERVSPRATVRFLEYDWSLNGEW